MLRSDEPGIRPSRISAPRRCAAVYCTVPAYCAAYDEPGERARRRYGWERGSSDLTEPETDMPETPAVAGGAFPKDGGDAPCPARPSTTAFACLRSRFPTLAPRREQAAQARPHATSGCSWPKSFAARLWRKALRSRGHHPSWAFYLAVKCTQNDECVAVLGRNESQGQKACHVGFPAGAARFAGKQGVLPIRSYRRSSTQCVS